MERFIRYLQAGLEERQYGVRVFHRANSAPPPWQNPDVTNKLQWSVAGAIQGYFIGRAARRALHPGVKLVLSNSIVGWFPMGNGIRRAHFHHGTYRGHAERIRPFIRYRGYLKSKWWDSMVLERFSGRGTTVLCPSELVRDHVRRFFKYDAAVMWYPLDLDHFRPLDRSACRRELGLTNTVPIGLFVGSTLATKGFSTVEHLIRAFPHVQWLLALIGEVPEALENAPNVRVFRNAPHALLPTLYNAADFSLCPSRYDSLPYVVLEALACGTPVIASPHGASWTFHRDTEQRPLLVDSTDDVQGFERAVEMVARDPDRWREIVARDVRPRLEALMAPANWWPRFLSMVGLPAD